MNKPAQQGVTRLFLVRHGETEASAPGLIAGRRLDPPLSPRGIEQAADAARRLAGTSLAAVYSSDRLRAVTSARLLAEPRGLEVVQDPCLSEIDFGAMEGLTFDEAARRYPEDAAAWLTTPHLVRFPGGEDLEALRLRVLPAVATIVHRHPSSGVALVCHGGPIRAILAHTLDLAPERAFRIDCDHASLSVIDFDDDSGSPFVRCVNVTS